MTKQEPQTIVDTDVRELNLDGVDPKLLEMPITFAFTTRGNDIFYRTLTYLLQQKDAFKNMCLVAAINMWRASCELMLKMVVQTPGEFCHILDTDVAPHRETTIRLVGHNVDIVASPVWFYDGGTNSIHLNFHQDDRCLREHTPMPPEAGLKKIFSTSFGSVLIKRRVLDTFLQAKEAFTEWSGLIDKKFESAAPDTIFFAKANALGFDVFIDWGCEVGTHHKYVSLNSPTIETFVAHRLFDLKYGPEHKRELLGTIEGRQQLGNDLARGLDLNKPGHTDS